jgi:general secretion pathway protein J
MSTAGQNEHGFTLVELLVTLTLLSLLVLLLFGGLRFGVRAWDGAQAHSEGADEMRVVQTLLRNEIEQAYPSYDMTDPLHPVVNFVGDGDFLTFLAPAPDAAGSAGRSWITLTAAHDGSDRQLVIRAVPELAVSQRAGWSSAILDHVSAIRFSYFGDGGWSASWHGAKTMPHLVRVHVEFTAGDRRVWPDLIVAPRIETDAACAVPNGARGCQDRS